ncbi:ABC transporter substrate-binding protein [Caproiciproducens faecalis]|uniref:ABC transporter substrate-binding protein n=1 Tax=Caproiciproducens faecalis TaxID=2820301 RepID=A0ABS7DQN7_9FIRM|nr:ABC transporter substrate-binding protein [Caproiciproducens faecalis]MBW7572896.1 ABC transporter substrate-binding protein [Caproiciproducens faecalis]
MLSAMAGCAGKQGAQSASGGAGSSQAAKSGKNDTLVYGSAADARGLDPALVDDVESVKIMSNLYEGLLKYKKDSTEVEPCLAESWDVSADGLTYVFHLRKGVKFQDGTDFNADAVKFNIDRQLPPKVTEDMSYASFVYGAVKDVQVVDENTVKINLKEPCTPFLNNLAMNLGALIVSPKALQDNNNNVNEHPVGTGAYKFVSWQKDQNTVLVRNDDYWGTKALTKNVVFRTIKDNSARVVALNNGEVDIIDGIDHTVVDQVTSAGNQIIKSPGMNINYMAYNCSRAPFNNAKARAAISAAINVPELVETLYKGYSEAATSILPTFMPGYDKSVQQAAYDPEAAKVALKEAGITQVHMITYTSARMYNPANGQTLAEAIQGYLSKVGVTCTIDAYDWTTYKTKQQQGDFDICFAGWIGDNGDADNFLNLLAVDDPGMNYARFNNQQYKDMIAKAVKMPMGAQRNAAYSDAEKLIAKESPWLPISHSTNLIATSPKIQNFLYHATGMLPLAGVTKNS